MAIKTFVESASCNIGALVEFRAQDQTLSTYTGDLRQHREHSSSLARLGSVDLGL